MRVDSGTPEDHPTPLPLDEGQSPPLARPTEIVPGQLTPADQGGVRDTTGEFQSQMHADAAMVAAVQAGGETAEDDRRAGYERQALPLGGQIGDNLVMPVVPDNAVIPASSDQYPWPGDEPLPSSAGPSYQGNVPMNSS